MHSGSIVFDSLFILGKNNLQNKLHKKNITYKQKLVTAKLNLITASPDCASISENMIIDLFLQI